MYDKIKKILVDEMNIKESNITLDSELTGDLGFNSLELADLVMLCEEKFGISFDDDDLSKLITVRDVVEYIESKHIFIAKKAQKYSRVVKITVNSHSSLYCCGCSCISICHMII